LLLGGVVALLCVIEISVPPRSSDYDDFVHECQEAPEAPGCASLSRSDFPEEPTTNYFPFFNFGAISRNVPFPALVGIALFFALVITAATLIGRRRDR